MGRVLPPLSAGLHWLPVRQRIICKTAVLVWKCLHDTAPRYQADLFVPAQSVHGRQQLRSTASGFCWSRVPRLLPVSAASPSMDHEHSTVCQPILEHQIRLCAPSCVISRPTCFSSSLRCCWQVGSAPFVRRRCELILASSAPFTNIQTY